MEPYFNTVTTRHLRRLDFDVLDPQQPVLYNVDELCGDGATFDLIDIVAGTDLDFGGVGVPATRARALIGTRCYDEYDHVMWLKLSVCGYEYNLTSSQIPIKSGRSVNLWEGSQIPIIEFSEPTGTVNWGLYVTPGIDGEVSGHDRYGHLLSGDERRR